MRPFSPWLLIAVAYTAAAAAPPGGAGPVAGSLAGRLALVPLHDAPALEWRTELRAADRDLRLVTKAEGRGTQIEIEAVLERGTTAGSWKINSAKFDLSAWEPALLGVGGSVTKGLHFAGNATVTGSGTFRGEMPTGEVVIAVQDGRVANPGAGWTLEGITLGGTFAVAANGKSIRSAAPLTLTIATITTKRFGARNLMIHGTLENPATFALSGARVEIAGGDMIAASMSVTLSPLRFVANVTLNRLGLQDIAALVPTALTRARGRVDGTVELGWDGDRPQLGPGHLVIREDEPAEVTLRPFPGLLTSWMRPWMRKLPSWLVRWPGPKLIEAEMGRIPIETKTLDVTFSPQPDAEGRTAVVHLVGVPQGAAGTPVDITTNVHGPLNPFVELGTETNLSFAIGK